MLLARADAVAVRMKWRLFKGVAPMGRAGCFVWSNKCAKVLAGMLARR
jgi:hypothetical protein